MSLTPQEKDQQLANLAVSLVGTTDNLDFKLSEHYPDLTEDDALEYLSAQNIEICEQCGWWCDDWGDKEGYDFICTECAGDA